jgi:hypothetical protein
MANSNTALVFDLEARTDKLEAAFKKSQQSANDNFAKMSKAGQDSAQRIDRSFLQTTTGVVSSFATMGGAAVALYKNLDSVERSANLMGKSLGAALHFVVAYRVAIGTFAAFTFAAHKSAEAIERMGQIAEAAEAAGVGTNFLQAWTGQAEKLGLKVEDVQKALTSARAALADKSDEMGKVIISPVQKMLDELYRTGQVVGQGLNSFLKADNVEQRIQSIKIAIKDMLAAGKELQAAKLSEMSFGGAGEQIVAGIKNGTINVEAMGAQARQTGAIFDAALIAKADELTERLKVARAEMESGWRPVMNDLGALGLEIKNGWVLIEEAIARASVTLGTFYTQGKAAYAELSKINSFTYADRRAEARLGIATGGKDAIISEGDLNVAKAYAEVAAKLRTDRLDKRGDISGLPDGSAAFLPKGSLPATAPLPPTRPTYTELAQQPRAPATPSSGSDSPDEVERYLARLQKTVEVLNAEAAAFGKSNVEREKSVRLVEAEAAARARGTPLTDEERKKVEDLATASGKAADKMTALNKARQGMIDAANFGGEQILDAFDAITSRSQTAQQVIANLTKALAKAALQAALLGQGPLAGIFGLGGTNGAPGGLIGKMFFAEGGPVSGPGSGTSDSIPAMVSNGEFIVRASRAREHSTLLHAINSGRLPRFANGGLVAPKFVALPSLPGPAGAAMAAVGQAINLVSNVTVNASGGDHAQNNDLAKQVSAQVEQTMRNLVVSVMRDQMRPGNLLNR